jgi:hypothetical protein
MSDEPQAEATEATPETEAVAEPTPTEGSLLEGVSETPEPSAVTGDWRWVDGINGEGDRPEWFRDKYKTVADQAKAYTDLEKKVGQAAPDEYEVVLPETVNAAMLEGDPMLDWFKTAAKEANLGQESFNHMLTGYIENQVRGINHDRSAEMDALGPQAQSRLKTLASWGQGNLSAQQWEVYKGVASSAEGVELLEALVGKSREAPLAKATPAANTNTPDDLRKMRYAKTEEGQLRMAVDAPYKKRVESAYKDYYGEQSVEAQVTQ